LQGVEILEIRDNLEIIMNSLSPVAPEKRVRTDARLRPALPES
jgi:hypothetical protein